MTVTASICRCILLSVFLSVAGSSLAKGASSHDAGTDTFVPGSVVLVPSSQTIDIQTTGGMKVTLPRYKKIEKCHLSFPLFDEKLDLRQDLTPETLQNKLSEQQEIRELSEKLTITNIDTDYLNFYRTVAEWLGTRYRMGSMNRQAVDCSGFTKIIYDTVFHKDIPRTSRDMSNSLTESLSVDELKPGDLVFFATRGKKYINHVGMYLSEGSFIHASIKGVKVSTLSEGYYQKTWRKAGRIQGE